MFQEEFCQLFGRRGVPAMYQVPHLREPAGYYQYCVITI
jgi:hypothetical protein